MTEPRTNRLLHLAIVALVLEVGLFTLGHFGPALKPLLKWVYPAVALIFAIMIWRARSRHNDDRRQGQRRA